MTKGVRSAFLAPLLAIFVTIAAVLPAAAVGTPTASAATAISGAIPAANTRIAATTKFYDSITTLLANHKSLYYDAAQNATGRNDVLDYQMQQLWQQGNDGAGVTVAVIGGIQKVAGLESTLATYSQNLQLPAADLTQYTMDMNGNIAPATNQSIPCSNNCMGDAGEIELDVESIHTMAPYAKIIFVGTQIPETYGMQGWPQYAQAITTIAQQHLADVISTSYSDSEANFSNDPTNPGADQTAAIRSLDPAFLTAAQAGIPTIFSSGDNGPSGSPVLTNGADIGVSAGHPNDSPWVTAVGGTVIDNGFDTNGKATAPDQLWPGSGSGVSSIYPQPSWQQSNTALQAQIKQYATITGGATGRAYPDISLDSNAGTSQAAPTFAGILAIATQVMREKTGNATGTLGNPNAAIAAIGPGGAANGIADVTVGNNAQTNPTVPGFQAALGYDIASGWGSIKAPAFVNALTAELVRERGSQALAASKELSALQQPIQISTVASSITAKATGFIPGRTPNGTTLQVGYGISPPLPGQITDSTIPAQTPTAAMQAGQTWDSIHVSLTTASGTPVTGVNPTVTGPDALGTVTVTVNTAMLSHGNYVIHVSGLLQSRTIAVAYHAAGQTGGSNGSGADSSASPGAKGSAGSPSATAESGKANTITGPLADTGANIQEAILMAVAALSLGAALFIARKRMASRHAEPKR